LEATSAHLTVVYDRDMRIALALLGLAACGRDPAVVPGDGGGDGGGDAGDDAPAGVAYATNFDGSEAPISEGGRWTHAGLDWTLVETASGVASGTQTGNGGFDDSYAHLSGFPADQRASAVVHRDAVIDPGCTHEVEILLRWSDDVHDAHGYECNLAYDGSYAQIVRWEGPFGQFTYIGSGSVPGGVHDGDTLAASAIGGHITLSVNGTEVAQADDATFVDGDPGIGFWRGGPCGARGDYGFTSFTAEPTP